MANSFLSYTVTGQQISGDRCPYKMASNTVNYVSAAFTFDDDWRACDVIKAVWYTSHGTQIAVLLDDDGSCMVPHEVLKPISHVSVNLVGCTYEDDTLVERITTYPKLAIVIERNARLEGSETTPVTPSQFDQYVSLVHDDVEKVTGMRAEAETLPAGSQATAEYKDGVLYIGIPASGGGGGGDAVWGSITGTLSSQEDLQAALDAKQAALTAGTGITITGNVISTDITETDPVFAASPAHDITAGDITAWTAKQDKLTAGTNISITSGIIAAPDVYTKTESDTKYAAVDTVYTKSQVYTKSEVDALFAQIVDGDDLSYGG